MHVGMTRAKECLVLTSLQQKYDHATKTLEPIEPAAFLDNLAALDPIDFEVCPDDNPAISCAFVSNVFLQ